MYGAVLPVFDVDFPVAGVLRFVVAVDMVIPVVFSVIVVGGGVVGQPQLS